MATLKGSIAVTLAVGSALEVASWIAGGASYIGTVTGVASVGFDRMMMRPVVGSAVWTDDPNVAATMLSASVGIPMGAADSSLPILVPGDPKNVKIKALGVTVLTAHFYEGGIISIS